MRVTSFLFHIEEAIRNIRRNGLMSLAALSTTAVAMAILGGTILTVRRLHQFADAQPRQLEMQVFVTLETSRERVEAILKDVSAMRGVDRVHLYPKERAWKSINEESRKDTGNLAETMDGLNPLPDRLDIHMADPRAAAGLAAILRDPKRFPEVAQVLDSRELLDKLLGFSRLVGQIGLLVGLAIFFACMLVVQNAIRTTLYARRREIHIMQLVGATPGFIRLPLVLEGLIYGTLGSGIGSTIVLMVARQVTRYGSTLISPLTQSVPDPLSPGIFAFWMAVTGALIGVSGSLISIRRNMRRI